MKIACLLKDQSLNKGETIGNLDKMTSVVLFQFIIISENRSTQLKLQLRRSLSFSHRLRRAPYELLNVSNDLVYIRLLRVNDG